MPGMAAAEVGSSAVADHPALGDPGDGIGNRGATEADAFGQAADEAWCAGGEPVAERGHDHRGATFDTAHEGLDDVVEAAEVLRGRVDRCLEAVEVADIGGPAASDCFGAQVCGLLLGQVAVEVEEGQVGAARVGRGRGRCRGRRWSR